MTKGQAAVLILLTVLVLAFSVGSYIGVNACYEALSEQETVNRTPDQIGGLAAATSSTVAVRGTVLEQNGAAIPEVTIWLYRDTGGGNKLINVKLIEDSGGFAFYISPVQGTYLIDIDLPGGYAAVGPESYTFTLASNKFWEFKAKKVTPTPTNTRTAIPTETLTPSPSVTAPSSPTRSGTPTLTPEPCSPTPTPLGGATLDIPAAARWLIAQAVYDSLYWQEKIDPYDDFMDSPFWAWSQEEHQLGLPMSKTVHVTVNGKTYLAMGFLCEILAYEETDPTKFCVIDYGGRQVNKP